MEKIPMNDDYPTCAETYATLRIYHPMLDPKDLTTELGLEPTETQKAGEPDDHTNPRSFVHEIGGWFLETSSKVSSRDIRCHISWLLDRLEPKRDKLDSLQSSGYEVDIFCYWLSAAGHGGPSLDPQIMQRLADLGLSVSFDVYFFPGGVSCNDIEDQASAKPHV
jgi:hypothetical protein